MMTIRLTRTVKVLAALCFVSFLVQQTGDQFFGTHFNDWFGLVPYDFVYRYRYWQVITYAFLHADVLHLFFNLLMLAFLGSELEGIWGSKQFLKYYLFCGACAGLVYAGVRLAFFSGTGLLVPMIGASGAIYGLLTAFGILFGERVFLFMLLFPMKAKHFVLVLGLIELMTTVYSSNRGFAGVAHLAGMVAGFAYLWVRARSILRKKERLSGSPRGGKLKKKRSNHLKLIVDNDPDDASEDHGKSDPTIWH